MHTTARFHARWQPTILWRSLCLTKLQHTNLKKAKVVTEGNQNMPFQYEYRRYEYPLTKDSIIFDLGAYRGTFADIAWDTWGSNIHCFEPVQSLHKDYLIPKFESNDKVHLYEYAISDATEERSLISGTTQAGSICKELDTRHHLAPRGEHIEVIETRSMKEVLEDFEEVDLIKINIEGEEYPLLNHMIDEGLIQKFNYIQVQFHPFIKNAEEKTYEIYRKLQKTHECMWDYPWKWSSWKRYE